MPVYRKIHTSYWQDPFVLGLPFEETAFYLYLLTNSKTKQCGLYELPIQVIELETGLGRNKIETLYDKFIEYGKISRDKNTSEILIKNWTKHNYNSSPKVLKCIEKELKQVKSKNLKEEYDRIVREYLSSIDTPSQKEKEEVQEEIKEEGKEVLLLEQILPLLNILNLETNTDNKMKCRSFLLKNQYTKTREAFIKTSKLDKSKWNLETVEDFLNDK